ncbi:unnamed protein product [Rotaria socialis]
MAGNHDTNQNYPYLIFYFLEMNLPDRDQSKAIDLKTKQYLIFQGEYLRGIRSNTIKTLFQTNLALKNLRHQLDNEMSVEINIFIEFADNMRERIIKLLSNEYDFSVDQLNLLEGGFRPDETYLLITTDQVKYVVKYIEYSHSLEHLQSILQFEKLLHDSYEYLCPQIILSSKQQLVIRDDNRFLFIQTFIEGVEPTREILDKDDIYLHKMGHLLAQWRIASREYSSSIQIEEEDRELTDQWWKKQTIQNVDPFLLSNFLECKKYLINLKANFERGLIHNDFHANNSIMTNDGNIFIIDFVDACQSVFVADLATSLFHLLVDQQNGEHRAQAFLQGYQQTTPLIKEEINALDMFVRFKLTLSIIEDLRDSNDNDHPFIQSCFHLLHKLNNHSTLVKNLCLQHYF